jgi:hypothetical protein
MNKNHPYSAVRNNHAAISRHHRNMYLYLSTQEEHEPPALGVPQARLGASLVRFLPWELVRTRALGALAASAGRG